MRADLDASGELVMSESVAAALSESIGRPAAQELVTAAAAVSKREGRSFRQVLMGLPEVSGVLGAGGLDAALDPGGYLGVTDELIGRALAEHARLRESR
jgi:adenylosuccinate lyase